MDEKLIGNVINNLPIEKMVAAPLTAAMKAQSEMSMALARYIQSVGMDKNGNVRMVTFNYSDESGGEKKERHIEAPFLAMTGLPNLAVENVDISFDLSIATAEVEKKEGQEKIDTEVGSKWFSPVSAKMTGSVTHSSSQTRSTDTRAKYAFHVSARKQQAPEALLRIIDAITDSATRPIEGKKENALLTDMKQDDSGKNPQKKPEGQGEEERRPGGRP